jgi:hypothetical protein
MNILIALQIYGLKISHAEEHTTNRPTAGNMGLKRYGLNVMWDGKPSMRWSSIVPVIQIMINCFGLPKAGLGISFIAL